MFEEHLGHSTFTLPNRPILDDALTGGVIPNFLSFSRPTSLIQSVVHGGDNIRFIFGLKPTFKSSVSIAISIAKTAGHPEYVGETYTVTSSSISSISLTIPNSPTVTQGISGSKTLDAVAHAKALSSLIILV